MTNTIEFASTQKGGGGAYAALAERSGKPLSYVVELAAADRLAELFDERGFVGRPQSPEEALRRLYQIRHAPGDKPKSAAARLGELRALKVIWHCEEREALRRRRDPQECLAEIMTKKWGSL